MIKTIFLILLLTIFLYPQTPLLSLYMDNEKFGYKDQDNQVIIRPVFDMATDFSDKGIAAVVDSIGWAYIDKQGRILVRPYIFDNGPDYFSEGLARFVENGKFGFFNEFGSIIIQPLWDFAYPFINGRAVVCMDCRFEPDGEHKEITGGKWGYIDIAGKIIVPVGSVTPDSVIHSPKRIEIFK